MTEQPKEKPLDTWAIVELMGHRRLAGKCSEEIRCGTVLLRVDVPGPELDQYVTQYYGGSSIYCLSPCSEEIARAVAVVRRLALMVYNE